MKSIVRRSTEGKLMIRELKIAADIYSMYDQCIDEEEVNWLYDKIGNILETLAEKRIEEIEFLKEI